MNEASGARSPHTSPSGANQPAPSGITRRALLGGAAVTGLGGWLAWPKLKAIGAAKAPVFLARNQSYDGPLEQTLADGLEAVGVTRASLAGRRVLLKPNLVEPSRLVPHMTTHPAMIVAAAHVFRSWGAQVTVGEGPGHVRDTELALIESGVQAALEDAGLDFADLNYEDVVWRPNLGRASKLDGFWFPRSVVEADLIVSMPKMKTHHWVGFTGALKNMYGVIPGIKYGWPKNVLHHAGIPETVYDINASLPGTIAIVDGIVAMEGDGPIMGSPKPMGLVAIGASLPAVDATLGRIMGLVPDRVGYLRLAGEGLGPIDASRIVERGEPWRGLVSPFRILDKPHLQQLRRPQGALVS